MRNTATVGGFARKPAQRVTRAEKKRAQNFASFVVQNLVRAGSDAPKLVSNDSLVQVYFAWEASVRARL